MNAMTLPLISPAAELLLGTVRVVPPDVFTINAWAPYFDVSEEIETISR
jgi:hypothetical protein